MLFKQLNYLVKSMSSEEWLAQSGMDNRSGVRGAEYYKMLNLSVYDREEGANLELKKFAVDHVRDYQPAVFLDLASDW